MGYHRTNSLLSVRFTRSSLHVSTRRRGFSLQAVTALNIVIGGAAAVLIYLCGTLAFNRFCGLAAGLLFALDPTQLLQTPQACSEPLGLLFFVASVYAVLCALENRRGLIFLLGGVFVRTEQFDPPPDAAHVAILYWSDIPRGMARRNVEGWN